MSLDIGTVPSWSNWKPDRADWWWPADFHEDDYKFLPTSVSGPYELHPEEQDWDDWNVPVRGRRRSQPGEWIEDSTMSAMFELGADPSLRPAWFENHPIEETNRQRAAREQAEKREARTVKRRKAAERARKRRQAKTVGFNRYNCHRDDVPCPYCNSKETTPWDTKIDPDWTCVNCGSNFIVRATIKLEVAQ